MRDALTEAALKKISEEAAFARGKAYFEDRLVEEWKETDAKNGGVKVAGTVLGSSVYRASLFLDAEGRLEFYDCSCPYDWGGACKHVVALGLTYLADRESLGTGNAPNVAEGEPARGLVQQATRPRASRPAETYRFDGITLEVSYSPSHDMLTIDGVAAYGPLDVRLGAQVADHGTVKDDSGRLVPYRIERNRVAEADCLALLRGRSFAPVMNGRVLVHGGDIYKFVKNVLPELREEYTVKVDPSAARIVEIDRRAVGADWQVGASGADLLSFSVEWHCGQSKISQAALRGLVDSWTPYMRDADGRFIECENPEEAARMLAFVQSSTQKNGKLGAKFFRVPELMQLIASTSSSRMQAVDESVRRLLEDTRTGKTLAPVVLPEAVKGVLRPYQVHGIEWGMFLRAYRFGGILADDMGLGKTLQALTLIATQREEAGDERKPSLVVCPKTLVGVWVQEAAKFFPELNVVAVEGTAPQRAVAMARIDERTDIVVASYPSIIREAARFAAKKLRFAYCVADEAQYMKNSATATAAAMKTVSAEHRLALTGTPIENGVHELWSIFDFLMPGFLGDRKEFRKEFELPIGKRQDMAAMARLKAMTTPFMLRRTKETELKELPPKIEQTRPCTLTPEQLTIYAHTLEEARREVFDAVEEKGFARSRIQILAALMRLRRVCDHPSLVDPRLARTAELSGKMQHAIELVQEAVAGGHKVLLFSQFTTMLDILRETLDREGVGHCTIEGKTKDRAAQVKRFEEDPEAKVFLLSLKAGGTGLTLTAADTVILYDPWWNPMAERQAMDRAHRIGQTKTVNVYKLVTQETIEERILQLQDRKKKVFDALVTENAGELAALTWEDVRGLFE